MKFSQKENFTILSNAALRVHKPIEFARFPIRAPRAVALASSACVDKTTKIITEFTRKDPFLRLKRVN